MNSTLTDIITVLNVKKLLTPIIHSFAMDVVSMAVATALPDAEDAKYTVVENATLIGLNVLAI